MLKGYRPVLSASTQWAWVLVLWAAAPAAVAQSPDIEASLHGLILMNGFHTTEKVNNSDVPQFVVPEAPGDNPAASATSSTPEGVPKPLPGWYAPPSRQVGMLSPNFNLTPSWFSDSPAPGQSPVCLTRCQL